MAGKSRIWIDSGSFGYPTQKKINAPILKIIKISFTAGYLLAASVGLTYYWSKYYHVYVPKSHYLIFGWRVYIPLVLKYSFGPAPIFKISFILLTSLAAAIIIYRFWLSTFFSPDKNRIDELMGSAHWADKDEIIHAGLMAPEKKLEKIKSKIIGAFRHFVLREPKNPGIILGGWAPKEHWPEALQDRYPIRYLRDNGPKHAIMCAPTRSGKGVGVIVPTLLSWTESVLVLDIKGENYLLSAGWREQNIGPCYRLDFTDPTSAARYNPLKEIHIGTDRETSEIQNIVSILMDPNSKDEGDHWKESAKTLVTGAITHELYKARKEGQEPLLENVLNSIIEGESKATMAKWQSYEHLTQKDPVTGFCHPVVYRAANDIKNRPDDERGSVVSTAAAQLNLFYDMVICRNTSNGTISVNDLMNAENPVSLYLVVPPSDIVRIRPLLRLMVTQVVLGLTRQMVETDHGVSSGHKYKLLLMLDEFPQLKKLEVLESAMAQMGGYGLKAFIICQSYKQLADIYGKDETISTNCHYHILYAPNDEDTAEIISKRCGKTTVIGASRTTSGNIFSAGPFAPRNENLSLTPYARDLVTPDEAKRLPGPDIEDGKWTSRGGLFLFAANCAPILGIQTPYFLPNNNFIHRRSKIKPLQSKRKPVELSYEERVRVDLFKTTPTHPAFSKPLEEVYEHARDREYQMAKGKLIQEEEHLKQPEFIEHFGSQEYSQLESELQYLKNDLEDIKSNVYTGEYSLAEIEKMISTTTSSMDNFEDYLFARIHKLVMDKFPQEASIVCAYENASVSSLAPDREDDTTDEASPNFADAEPEEPEEEMMASAENENTPPEESYNSKVSTQNALLSDTPSSESLQASVKKLNIHDAIAADTNLNPPSADPSVSADE